MPASEPKTLDELAEDVCEKHGLSDYYQRPILAALTEARDLGRAERDKEWKALFGRGLTPEELALWTEATSRLSAEDFAEQITKTAREEIARRVAQERKALREMHDLIPAVMDALESDADLNMRRKAFESIQEAYEPDHAWGRAIAALDAREKESR